MKIFFDNVGFEPVRGPSCFAGKLASYFKNAKHQIANNVEEADVHLAFIWNNVVNNSIPLIQRLDGIYFSSKMNNDEKNKKILKTYQEATAVIVQSEFDRQVAFNFFGEREDTFVIHNGTDFDYIEKIKPIEDKRLDYFEQIWVCASRWEGRTHKRLNENIRYFLENSADKDGLVITGRIGSGEKNLIDDAISKCDRISYWGNLEWKKLMELFKRANYFIHLAITDHCPNVVVDARGCGCHIICSSLGGTEEIAGKDAIVIEDYEWDLKSLFDYRNPPLLDFSKRRTGKFNNSIDINDTGLDYLKVLTKFNT